MAIFSRRVIQKLINENASFCKRDSIKKHVNGLNLKDIKEKTKNEKVKDAIANEWEVVLLNTLSKIGKVFHEKDFSGKTSNIDVFFSSETNDFRFIGDITAVSDVGLHQKYPIQTLYFQISDLFDANGIDSNKLYIEAKGNSEEAFRGKERSKLFIPGEGRFKQEIFETDRFQNFLSAIKSQPSIYLSCHFAPFKLTITYDPNRRSPGFTHDSFTHTDAVYKPFYDGEKEKTYTITERRNPIYSALESKRNQLLKTGYKENLGIFLCDGSSDLFQQRGDWYPEFGVDRTIKDFLKQNNDISFVICFTVQLNNKYNYYSAVNNTPSCEILVEYFVSPSHVSILENIKKIADVLREKLPIPVNHVSNAINCLKGERPHEGKSFRGGGMFSSKQIEVSSRELLEVLAGKSTFIHGISEDFARLLNQGKLIENISIKRIENEDDEYIVFNFGEPDPAISPFTIPKENQNK
jgi:hypothetical protein